MASVKIKTDLYGDMRRLTLKRPFGCGTFDTFLKVMRTVYYSNNYDIKFWGYELVVKYTDEDGDLITLTKLEELEEAAAGVADGESLRLTLLLPKERIPTESPLAYRLCEGRRERRVSF